MLSDRESIILRSIIRQYITGANPVASKNIGKDAGLEVSSATIRNEMVRLEEEGYIIRPHHASGGIPTDKGYRYYVETLSDVELPVAEQRLINHLFYQAERKLNVWLALASSLTAQMVKAVSVVTAPKPVACQFKHLELISIKDSLVLMVLVLHGAKVRQELLAFNRSITQPELTSLANKFNDIFANLNRTQISAKKTELTENEQMVMGSLIRLMETEDGSENDEHYLEGWHFMLKEPEFSRGHPVLSLIELAERHNLIRNIIPQELATQGVQVVIGSENKSEAIQNYSVVISRYGVPEKALGTIGVVGPTRMSYIRAISTVDYLSSILSRLVAELYGTGAN